MSQQQSSERTRHRTVGRSSSDSVPLAARAFATTRWSLVVAARAHESPEASAALETLCRNYWYPLYAFVRRQGYSPEDAQDLTQAVPEAGEGS